MRILAETARQSCLLTIKDASRVLQLSDEGVRHLVRKDQLSCEWTLSGQRLFRYGVVMKVAQERASARLQRRGALLAAVHVRMVKAGAAGEARQLALDFSARLKLVGARGKGRKVA